MSPKEAATLRANDRVTWGNDANDAGTVIESGYTAVIIRWDNGQTGTIAHQDSAHIDPAECRDCGETGPCAPSCHQVTDSEVQA